LSKEPRERERQANIYGKEEGILGEAEYHIRRPIPSITAGARPTIQHGGRKPPASCPKPLAERHTSHRAKSRADTPPLAHGVPNKVNKPIRRAGEKRKQTRP